MATRGYPQQAPSRPTAAAVSIRGNGLTSSSALRLCHELGYEDWLGVGRQLADLSRASAWWLGDWIVYGERAYGRRYKAALTITSLDYQTLRNYAWVARSFEVSRRRDSLSFQHHAEVAGMPEADQELWLRRAERFGWTRSELRRQLGGKRPSRRQARDSDAVVLHLHLHVPTLRQQRWRAAAGAANQELAEWIAGAADFAADSLLERGGQEDAAGDQDGLERTTGAAPVIVTPHVPRPRDATGAEMSAPDQPRPAPLAAAPAVAAGRRRDGQARREGRRRR